MGRWILTLSQFKTLVIPLLFLLLLLPFNNCRFADPVHNLGGSVSSSNGLFTPQQISKITSGVEYYNSACAACHGDVLNSMKRNRNVLQIRSAINSVSAMSSLVATDQNLDDVAYALNDNQLTLLKAYLNGDFNSSSNSGGNSPLKLSDMRVPIGTRTYMASFFRQVFVNESNSTATDTALINTISSLVLSRPEAFEGPCQRYDSNCPNETVAREASMSPLSNTIRKGYGIRICEQLTANNIAVQNSLAKAGLTVNDSPTDQNLLKLYDLFYPGQSPTALLLSDLSNIHQDARQNNMNNTDAWRFTILPLCTSAASDTFTTDAQPLSELALFYRCYGQLTQERPDPSAPLTQDVRSGRLNAVDACLQVLNSGTLASNGQLLTDTQLGRTVLNNMHRLHASWFQIKSFPNIGNGENNIGMQETFDSSTPALYITKALLTQNTPFSYVATSQEYIRPVRTNDNPSSLGTLAATDFPFTPFRFSARGDLLGWALVDPQPWQYSTTVATTGVAVSGTAERGQHFGAGFLGTQDYGLLTVEAAPNFVSDGAVLMPRKWARGVFHDLLCRDLPVARETDVTQFVDVNSAVPFRQTSTCVRCHASMDRMASTIRGFHYQTFGANNLSVPRGGMFATLTTPTQVAEQGWPAVVDNQYNLRPPNGTLFYRDHQGSLIDLPVTSLTDLGNKLAAQDDMYICLARRYYKYFTGIDVNISDPGDPSATPLTADDLVHRAIIVSLGKKLKQHQSAKQLIQDILNMPHYRLSDFGVSDSRGLASE